jgi:hypothetical protein
LASSFWRVRMPLLKKKEIPEQVGDDSQRHMLLTVNH